MSWQDIRKQFMDNYLMEELFESNRGGYSICLYAGAGLIALCNDNAIIERIGEPFWFFISENDAFTLIKHSANGTDRTLFLGAIDKVKGILTYKQMVLDEAFMLRAEVERGEKKAKVSEEGLRTLKEGYIAYRQKEVDRHGVPPKFSDAKFGECAIACFFSCIGAPYWLVGRPLPALLCIGITVLMLITLNPLFVFLVSVCMIVNFYIVLSGKLKDRKGRYVLPAGQKEGIIFCLNLVEKYKKELHK